METTTNNKSNFSGFKPFLIIFGILIVISVLLKILLSVMM